MIPPDEHATLQTVMDNLCSQLNTKYGIKPAQLHERGDVMDKHYYLACNNRSPDIIDVIMRLLEKENKRLNNVVEKPYQSLNDPTETGTEHQNRLNQTNNPEISR